MLNRWNKNIGADEEAIKGEWAEPSEARLPGAERAFKRLLVRVSKAESKITQPVPFSM